MIKAQESVKPLTVFQEVERLRRLVLIRDSEIVNLKQELRCLRADIPFSVVEPRPFCDDCIQRKDTSNGLKCGLGHKDLFFRVPCSYADIYERNYGWFRYERCEDFSK